MQATALPWGGFYGCHAHPECFTCRADRSFRRVGTVTRYCLKPGSLVRACLRPMSSLRNSWAVVYSMYDLQFGNAISTFSSNQYLRGPLVYLIRSLQPGASTMWCNGSDGGVVRASASLSSYMDASC